MNQFHHCSLTPFSFAQQFSSRAYDFSSENCGFSLGYKRKSDTWKHCFKSIQIDRNFYQKPATSGTMKVLLLSTLLVSSVFCSENTETETNVGNRLAKVLPIFQVVT